jgi:hypothetical protein
MSDPSSQTRTRLEREIAAITSVDPEISAAVWRFDEENAELTQRFYAGELTNDAYFAAFEALMKRTPREVVLTSHKLQRILREALGKDSETTEA